MDCAIAKTEPTDEAGDSLPANRQMADLAPSCNPNMTASDERWETVRTSCQLFREAVKSAACEALPLMPLGACDELMQTLLVERIAEGMARVLRRFEGALAVRFEERRIVDNECYYFEVTDILTGERGEFSWTYGGGKAASLWKVERLLALARKGVAA